MRAWLAFVVIGLMGAFWASYRGRILRRWKLYGMALLGSLVGGYVGVQSFPPAQARLIALIFAAVGASFMLWLDTLTAREFRVGRDVMLSVVSKMRKAWSQVPGWLVSGILVVYCFGVGSYAYHTAISTRVENLIMMSGRQVHLRAAADVVKAGGPPLARQESDGTWRSVGVTDDQGIYLYYPLLMKFAQIDNPVVAGKVFASVFFAILVFSYPLVTRWLFGSVLIALLSPLPLLMVMRPFLILPEQYWMSAWVLLFCYPVLFAVSKGWKRYSGWILVALCVVASLATSMRVHAGLPVVICSVFLTVTMASTWRQRISWIALMAFAYMSVHPLLFDAVRSYRDGQLGLPLSHNAPRKHPIWHTVYVGLGIIPNPHGISWDDSVAYEKVKGIDPTVEYLSPQYEAILRREVFRIAREDPAFVAKVLMTKGGIIVDAVIGRFGLFAAVFCGLLFAGQWRQERRFFVVLLLPSVGLGLLHPLLSRPFTDYMLGWIATVSLVWMLGMASAIREGLALAKTRDEIP